MSVLEVRDFTYTYPGAGTRPRKASISSIEPGELVVLAGASGSGKSTLLRAGSGLVPHFHGGSFGGRVTVAGMDTREHRPGELAAAVGTLFQDPETQVVMGTVRAELAFGLENRGWTGAAVARGVEEAALALGIAHLLERPTAELSGGELQRVALGAALAGDAAADPARRAHLAARSRGRRRADRLAAAAQRGPRRGDRAGRAPARALPGPGRSGDRARSRSDRLRRVAAGVPELVAGQRAVAGHARRPAADGLGLRPAAGVKRARAALRAAGLDPEARAADPERSAGAPRRTSAAALNVRPGLARIA